MSLKGKHFLTISDFSTEDLQAILHTAKELKAAQRTRKEHRRLEGRCLAMIFEKPSNRTRVSFEVGMYQLGGMALNVRPGEIDMGQREPIPDVSRVMARYVDLVMMRVMRHIDIEEYARYSSVPVINGLSDRFHPCQAISDIMTIEEQFGRLKGLTMCYVGDGNNVCASLIEVCKRFEIKMVVSCPKGFDPELSQEEWGYSIVRDPFKAVAGADVVYTDVWTSMGQEEQTARREKSFRGYAVTSEMMSLAAPKAIFMHCLPAHRGHEVTAEVVESNQSVVFEQAENRLHAQKGIMVELLRE